MMDYWKLFEVTAEAMCKRHVLVRFRYPPTRDAMGTAYRPEDAPSLILIDIAPYLSLKDKYETLLHELSHVLLGHLDYANLKPIPLEKEISGSFELTSLDYQSPAESNTDQLAHELDAWADEKIKPHIQPGYPVEVEINLKLTALQFYNFEGQKS